MIIERLMALCMVLVGSALIAFVASTIEPTASVHAPQTKQIESQWTPPPLKPDPNDVIVQTLGALSRSAGWADYTVGATAVDLLATSQMPAALAAFQTPANAQRIRQIVLKYEFDEGLDASPNAMCFRVGPDTNSPALGCLFPGDGANNVDQGGCKLLTPGESCTLTVRQSLTDNCNTWADCHPRIWGSSTATLSSIGVSVGVFQ